MLAGNAGPKDELSDLFSSEDEPRYLQGPKAPSQLVFVPSMANPQVIAGAKYQACLAEFYRLAEGRF